MDKHVSELLKVKKKKPKFVMQDAHKKRRLKKKWRKPRGSDSKVRYKLRGYSRRVSIGYKTPKIIFGLNKDGLKGVLVKSLKDLDKIKQDFEAAIISKKIGAKKKIEIIKQAKNKSIKIINIKDGDAYIKKIEEKIKKRKEIKKKIEEKKEKKKVAKKEDLAEKIQKEETKTDKEKKEETKKEMDKALTKKGSI